MTFRKGEYGIVIEQVEGFGKRPGLWVLKGNTQMKMASFGSEEKAKEFEKYLKYFFFNNPIEVEE